MLFDLTRLKFKRSSILCRVATDAMYCRRFCAVIKTKVRLTNMNPRHGIFVLHYFFIEYSLAYFLKCLAAYRDFFFLVFLSSLHTGLLLRRHENHTAYSFCSHKRTVIWRDFCNGAKLRCADLESGAAFHRAFLLGRLETFPVSRSETKRPHS